jgi:hypothetical protein
MRFIARTLLLSAVFSTLWAASASAQTVNLYVGSGSQTPQSQGWLNYIPTSGSAVTTSAAGATTLDTTGGTGNSIMAGYFNYNTFLNAFQNPLFPTLNTSSGFTVNFSVQVNSESHSSNDRAGFSVIALGSDHTGVELGFWTGNVWAQTDSPLFMHGEDAAFNTSSSSHDYSLHIQGSTYTLSADGSQILTGATKNYSSFGLPYTLPSFLFLGDDTSSAAASETFTAVSVSVPEPATAFGAIFLLVSLARRRGMAR